MENMNKKIAAGRKSGKFWNKLFKNKQRGICIT